MYPFEPLTTTVFYILLALSRRSLHGYAIKHLIKSDSLGAITIADGNLYAHLDRLGKQRFIRPDGVGPTAGGGKARAHYAITPLGLLTFKAYLTSKSAPTARSFAHSCS